MPSFFDLPQAETMRLLNAATVRLHESPFLLEKDIYICLVLQALFESGDDGGKPMVFKGGTSLSKGFGLISRFSEDVDITVSYESLLDRDVDFSSLSKSAVKRISEELKTKLRDYAASILYPGLKARLKDVPGLSFSINEGGDVICVAYRPAAQPATGFVQPAVKIELGGRNTVVPHASIPIKTDISAFAPEIAFPEACVATMLPERTFWEKMTLMHEACHREQLRPGHNRYSRHWYDAYMLAAKGIADRACADILLLRDVIAVESLFFSSRYSNFQECLDGRFAIVPEGAVLDGLSQDYEAMRAAGMLYEQPVSFEQIVEAMRSLQEQINAAVAADGQEPEESGPKP